MSLVRGSQGLIYFVHQFRPRFKEAALLDDPEMLAAVTAINRQIRELAPVLNSPTLTKDVEVQSSAADTPIACMHKRYEGAEYVFAVNLRNRPTRGTFQLAQSASGMRVEVLEESRQLSVERGVFADDFKPYEVHLYRLKGE